MALLLRALRLYRVWVAGVAGYLLGSVLFADIAASMASRRSSRPVDLRAVGSGNPGGANAVVNLGRGWGAAVIAGDLAKGAAAAQAGRLVAGDAGAYAAAIGAVAGHAYPAFSQFRGGKGLATAAGTTAICFPPSLPVHLATWAGTYARSREVVAPTLAAVAAFSVAAIAWGQLRIPNWWGPRAGGGLVVYALAASGIVSWKTLTAPPHQGDRPHEPCGRPS